MYNSSGSSSPLAGDPSKANVPVGEKSRHNKPNALNLYAHENLLSLNYPELADPLTQSTPGGSVSPTILLSPVLSRPIRSQSSHSPPFLRSSLVLAPTASDSDTELSSCFQAASNQQTHSTAESPLLGSRATTLCAINEPFKSSSNSNLGTPVSANAPSSILTASALALGTRFGSPTQHHALNRHGSSASDSGSMYNYFYKRQSFRSNRDSSANNSLGSSSLNIPTTLASDSTGEAQTAAPSTTSPLSFGAVGVQAAPPCSSNNSSLSLHRIAVHQPRGNSLQRSHSEAQPDGSASLLPDRVLPPNMMSGRASLVEATQFGRSRRTLRRPSACVASFRGTDVHLPVYEYPSSNCSSTHASSSIVRARHLLGHSDPQLYTYSVSPCGRRSASGTARGLHLSPASAIRYRKASIFAGGSSHTHNRSHRLSILSAHGHESYSEPTSGIHSSNPSSTGALPNQLPSVRRRRRPLVAVSSGEGASGMAAGSSHHSSGHRHHHHHPHHSKLHHPHGVRSGSSLAAPYLLHHPTVDNRRWSLASLPSSSGYGTPGSISAMSSEYSSQEQLADLLGDLRFNNRYDSNDSYEDPFFGGHRPRSRSLSSPVRMHAEHILDTSMNAMSQLYKERFPKAKQQMETRLQQFLTTNAPLSGFTSSIVFDRPPSPLNFLDSSASSMQLPTEGRLPSRQLSCSSQPPQQSPTLAHHRPSSPCRPTSPLARPISPLATDSATAIEPGKVVFRSSTHNNSQLSCGTPYGNSSNSIAGSFSSYNYGLSSANVQIGESQSTTGTGATSRRSTMATCDVGAAPLLNPSLLRVLAEGATRFLHHQVCEIAADCLQKSRDNQLTSAYFCDMSIRLEESLAEAQQKTSAESLKFLASISKQLLMIVSRTARLLESLEFDPDEFYRLLEETEGAIRHQLGAGQSARIPDLPQYIIDKLGLNKNLLTDRSTPPELNEDHIAVTGAEYTLDGAPSSTTRKDTTVTEDQLRSITAGAPKEEDFENIRLISNGAYGAVYLVRHRKTRQRFALKKMKKQTLLLRNQVEQVYAERDILTFTDNPFVVCFYGSFETKQHLCMLMEYVEGGDCASLLKSAGVLPIEIAKLYLAETVLAIEYLHSCGIVHRDLKPDNLLITAMGHIKLTDFGLSKIGLMNRTTLVSEGLSSDTQQFKDNQLFGTPEYIAPEVILRQGYGKPVDWWATGIILYEFLVGIVPFLGATPEELFTNIINEEVEYPSDEEALEPSAESLIQMLLEKNPVDRLGTVGGASDVAAHPFFAQLDFNSLLRQKAEFVPNLENEEDTSYFDSRADRYNHDAEESGDDEPVPMFWSFSTASPRHSITAQDIPIAHLAALNAAAFSPAPSDRSNEGAEGSEMTERRPLLQEPAHGDRRPSALEPIVHSPLSARNSNDGTTPVPTTAPPPNSGLYDDPKSPSAILLRQRFSAQRQANYSTSSSGTTGTGCLNTCSSTDSSMDASYLLMTEGGLPVSRRQTTNFSPLPRFAISSCGDHHQPHPPKSPVPPVAQPRRATLSAEPEMTSKSSTSSNAAKRTESLRVFIPHGSSSSTATPSNTEKSGSQTSIYYHAAFPQASPDCQSRSSVSSAEPNSPQPPPNAPISPVPSSTSTTVPQTAAPPIHPTSSTVGKPVVIKKGPKGYGFTIRSVRVYLSESSEYYTIEHIVAAVRPGSPADEAGLQESDLITHVHTHAVHNMTHPQLMHRLLSSAGEITLHVIPIASTTIREGDARRQVGKLLRKKPKKPQRRVPLEKKATRKTSTLFRRLSGKRTTTDIVPGASSQKQSFMPRSASSQDGVALSLSPAPPMSQLLNDSSQQQHFIVQQAGTSKTSHDGSGRAETLTVSQSGSRLNAQPSQHISSRRSSGHQMVLPGVEEVVEPKMRRKHTTGSVVSSSSANEPVLLYSKPLGSQQQQPKPRPRHSIQEQAVVRHPPPLSPLGRTSTSGSSLNVSVPPLPPSPSQTASRESSSATPIPRPSTLLERRSSNTSSGSSATLEHKQSTSSGRLRPTDLIGGGRLSAKSSTASEHRLPAVETAASRSHQTDRPRVGSTEPPPARHEELYHDQPPLSGAAESQHARKRSSSRSIASSSSSVEQKQEAEPSTAKNTPMLGDNQVKRPPVPARRLSPSRLVQRLFRATATPWSQASNPPPPPHNNPK